MSLRSRRLDTKHRTNKFTDYELSFDSPVSPEEPSTANPFYGTNTPDDGSDADIPADSLISPHEAIAHWSAVPLDDVGMLGGYAQISKADLAGSAAFLTKLRRKSKVFPEATGLLPRVVDAGAGIGRVTKGFLAEVAEVIDIVEPVVQMTAVIENSSEFQKLRKSGTIGNIYNVGIEDWEPPPRTKYALVWNQWCLCQLRDQQLIEYLERIQKHVTPGGWIVVKEKIKGDDRDIFDETDHSVVRSDAKFRTLFERAGLRILTTDLQKGIPRELYPVRTYALIPADVGEMDDLSGEE